MLKTVLSILWRWKAASRKRGNFIENSPKRTSIFMQVQMELKDVALTEKAKKIVGKKIKKACRTHWLSLEQRVNSVFETYAALLHTFQELKKDALAVELLKKMKTEKFLGTIYILKEVVPCLTTLSKTFQAGALNFSHVGLAINHTQACLEPVKSSQSPLKKLQRRHQARWVIGWPRVDHHRQ